MTEKRQQALFAEDVVDDMTAWEAAVARDRWAAKVVLNRPLDTEFSYLLPDGLREKLGPGQRVRVPFGRGDRLTVGYCVGVEPLESADRKLKQVESLLDLEPLLSPTMLELTRWMAEYYLCGWGQVLESVIPAGVKRKSGTREINVFHPHVHKLDTETVENLPAKQRAVATILLQSSEPLTAVELTDAADCGLGPINALRKKGLIAATRERRSVMSNDSAHVAAETDLQLNDDQQSAVTSIVSSLREQQHRTFLLHGVTGSGKTEVYIQAIREVVSYGRQAIVLVPEISLTPQTIRRFRSRFESVAVLHSHLSDVERHNHWQEIAAGRVQVVVGARSAVFAPTPHLGMIVIDEEHETSFKQDSVPRYHAREVARKRAEMEQVPLVLGSATPTLESWRRMQEGDIELLSLPHRVGRLPMPPVITVDVRNDPYISHGSALGRALCTAMQTALEADGQVILFLNLRGYTPTLWCRSCGSGVMCPNCDITLTWHRDRNIALCHSCDYQAETMTHCPECGHAGIRHLGVGTQRLEQEVKARFPKAPCLRMDSDSMRKPGSHDEALESFRNGEVKILLGTQMIAKGLDFPNVTLVGVVSADTVLHQPDYRAAERTFQLISQVSGRTGRGPKGGRVFVQTCAPGEPAIRMAAEHNYHGFTAAELAHRRELNYPPYQHLVRAVFRGPIESDVLHSARDLVERLRELAPDLRILGPAPAPVLRRRSLFRYHLQISTLDLASVRNFWRKAIDGFRVEKDVEYVVDVDPLNMM